MDDRTPQLETRVEGLELALRRLERRFERLEESGAIPEGHGSWTEDRDAEAGVAPAPTPATAKRLDFTGALSLTGRSLLCLAGAYVPRMLTSEGLLPHTLGVAAGLAYAGLWLVMADRAGGRGRAASAAFHGATAVFVALPLIWETTVRFELLSPAASAAALTALATFTLITAGRRNLPVPAWIVSVGAGLAALMLGGRTHTPVPYVSFLVLLGIATVWLTEARGWRILAGVSAAIADLAILLLWLEDPIGKGLATVGEVLTIQLALFALYTASFSWTAHRRDREVTIGAALQTAVAAAVGYGGAVAIAEPRPAIAVLLGTASLALAVGAYVTAFRVIEEEQKRNVLFVSGLAVPLVLGGGTLLLDHPALLWSAAAILCSWLGSRLSRLTLSGHATLYALIAAVASGLFVQSTQALTAPGDTAWPTLAPGAVLAFVAIVACLAFKVRGDVAFWGSFARAPKLLLLILGCWGGVGLLIRLAGPLAAGEPGAEADPAILAAVRTAVLAAAALLLAWVGRSRHLREAAWLVYPVLLLGALKLLVEDFPVGRPQTLFLALAFYGGALITAPRLLRAEKLRQTTNTGGNEP